MQEIIENAKELSRNQDHIAAMDTQVKSLSQVVQRETQQIDSLSSILQLLEQVEQKRSASALDLPFLLEHFASLERKYSNEYASYDMPNVALTYLIPLVKNHLAALWRPFESTSSDDSCRQVVQSWRYLLESRTVSKSRTGMDPYDSLLWHAWMPALRSLVGQWKCKNAEPMVDLLDRWSAALPVWVLENILEQLVMPKIQKEVDGWDPLTDLIPIHAWYL